MDRALAAKHGATYVRLAAFAIDVDRVRTAAEEDGGLDARFGWDVVLTEAYLLRFVDPADPVQRAMLEEVVLDIVEGERDAETPPPLGSQLPFALYDAVHRGAWPEPEEQLFRRWKPGARRLVDDLRWAWKTPSETVPPLARAMLDARIEPPLAPPVREALAALARG